MKNIPLNNYEGTDYTSQEEYLELSNKNKCIKGGAAILAASLVGLSLTACEPPKVRNDDDRGSRRTTNQTDSTSETTVVRRFFGTTPTDNMDPDNDDFITAGIIMMPTDYDPFPLMGEIMIDDYDVDHS